MKTAGTMISPGMNDIVQITGAISDFNLYYEDLDVVQH